jgi:hypothetical protein
VPIAGNAQSRCIRGSEGCSDLDLDSLEISLRFTSSAHAFVIDVAPPPDLDPHAMVEPIETREDRSWILHMGRLIAHYVFKKTWHCSS